MAWLAFILSQSDHRLSYVEPWVATHLETLKRLINPELTEQDFSDDRLGDVLRYLSDDQRWADIERELRQRTIRVYQLPQEVVRLDSTSVSLHHDPEGTELIRYGHSKDHRPDLAQLKVMLATLDPLGGPVVTQVVAGNRADDGLYIPAIDQARTVLDQRGLLYIGDSKMEALDTRAHLVAGGNYQLRPLTAYELTASTLDGRPVAGFDEPITVQIQYRYDDLPEFLERTIGCFIWDEETEGWEISKAVVSPDQGVIQVQTEVTGIYAAAVTGLGTGGHYGTGPGRCASPYAQPTPSLFIDIPATFGQASIEEIEQRFGPSVERLPLDSDEEMVPLKGGEGRIYRVGNYGLIFMFDKQGIARGLQASLGYAGEKHALDDWAELLDRFNLHPDSSQGEFGDGGIFFRDAGGYDILMNSSISSYPFIADLWIMETGLLSQLLVDE